LEKKSHQNVERTQKEKINKKGPTVKAHIESADGKGEGTNCRGKKRGIPRQEGPGFPNVRERGKSKFRRGRTVSALLRGEKNLGSKKTPITQKK